MPLVTHHRQSAPEVAPVAEPAPAPGNAWDAVPDGAQVGGLDRSGRTDLSGASDDIAAWYPVFLATFLLGLLGLGGLWASHFAL